MTAGSAEYQVGVKLTGDAVDLKTEISSAETAIQGLDTTVSTTSDSIVNTSGRKLKAAGSTIGTDFATSMTSGIASGDIVGSVTGIFSSLAAVGGIAAIGVGLGGALITGLIKGAAEKEAEYRSAINDLMAAGEAEAEQSARQIQRSLFEAFDVQTALSQFGDGDVSQGIERVNELVEQTGLAFNEVVDIIRGQQGPAVDGILQTLQRQVEAGSRSVSVHGKVGQQLSDNAEASSELLAIYEEQNGKLDKAVSNNQLIAGYQRTQRDYVQDIAGETAAAAGQSERYAAALERADAAARLLAGRRLPSSDAMNGI